MPASPEAIVDVVTGDYVADALVALLLDVPRAARHATTSPLGRAALTVAGLRDLAAAGFGMEPGARSTRRAERSTTSPRRSPSYLDVRCRFDARRSQAALAPLGISPAPLPDAFSALVAYAERSAWGKRPLVREQARRRCGLERRRAPETRRAPVV